MHKEFIYIFLGLIVGGLIFSIQSSVVYNATPSFPIGFYRLRSSFSESDVVWFDVPGDVERLVFHRNYIPSGGKLMKKIIAVEGDRWCVTDRSMVIDGIVVGHIRTEDSRGLPLPQLPEGCNALGPDELIVVSNHPLSFDSRYFGPVKRSAVKGSLEELWIW